MDCQTIRLPSRPSWSWVQPHGAPTAGSAASGRFEKAAQVSVVPDDARAEVTSDLPPDLGSVSCPGTGEASGAGAAMAASAVGGFGGSGGT